jgi:hypothetical protein
MTEEGLGMFVQYSFAQDQVQDRVGAPDVELTPAMTLCFGLAAMLLTVIGYALS